MDGLQQLVIEVYDKDFSYQATVDRPKGALFTARHNAVGTGVFAVDANTEAAEALAVNGSRVVCRYRHDPDDLSATMHLLGGYVSTIELQGTLGAPTRLFTVADDWDLLTRIACRAVPGSGLGSQGGASTFHTVTGPMETVVKTLVSANAATVPTPLTVAATHGWGETVTVQARGNKLTDKIFPAMDYAHVGISVRQSGAGLLLDAYQPTVHAEPLTVESNIVAKAEGSLNRPAVSRVLVRGGEDTAAVWQQYINADVEAEYGFCGWESLEVPESTTTAYLEAKAWEVLNAGAAQASASIELAETADWRFGLTYGKGDEVTIGLPGGAEVAEVIREVEVGLIGRPKPKVGNRTDQVGTLAKAIQKVAAQQRVMRARG
jgi:hypothetical protein